MVFQSAPDCAEVIVRALVVDQNIATTFYAHKPGGYVQADIDALAEAVDFWVDSFLLPIMSNAYNYVGTTVRGLNDAIDLIAENNDSAGLGAVGGARQSNNVTLAVKRRSAFTGRGARGRIFFPLVANSQLEFDNIVSGTFVTAVEAALNTMKDTMGSVDWVEVILHRVSAGAPLAEAAIFTLVEYVVVDRIVDSMRRRLPGRGT